VFRRLCTATASRERRMHRVAEGHLPGLGESPVSTARHAVLDESRGLLAGRIIHWKTDYQQHIFAGWHERNTNPC